MTEVPESNDGVVRVFKLACMDARNGSKPPSFSTRKLKEPSDLGLALRMLRKMSEQTYLSCLLEFYFCRICYPSKTRFPESRLLVVAADTYDDRSHHRHHRQLYELGRFERVQVQIVRPSIWTGFSLNLLIRVFVQETLIG